MKIFPLFSALFFLSLGCAKADYLDLEAGSISQTGIGYSFKSNANRWYYIQWKKKTDSVYQEVGPIEHNKIGVLGYDYNTKRSSGSIQAVCNTEYRIRVKREN